MKTWTVICGRGFIGGHLERHLVLNGRPVRAFDSRECDFAEWPRVQAVLDEVPGIENLILAAWITRLKANDEKSFISNLRIALNLAQYLKTRSIRQVVFLSTIDLYDRAEEGRPLNEASALNPRDYYALSKHQGEMVLSRACGEAGSLLTIFRLSGVYGPGDRSKSTLHQLVSSAWEKRKVWIQGGGKAQRDFIHVRDVSRLTQDALERRVAGTYNIATGRSYSIQALVDLLRESLPVPISIEYGETNDSSSRPRNLQFDIGKLRRDFPRIPLTDLRVGLSLYLAEAWGIAPGPPIGDTRQNPQRDGEAEEGSGFPGGGHS